MLDNDERYTPYELAEIESAEGGLKDSCDMDYWTDEQLLSESKKKNKVGCATPNAIMAQKIYNDRHGFWQ